MDATFLGQFTSREAGAFSGAAEGGDVQRIKHRNTIGATLQHDKMHFNKVRECSRECYATTVKPHQQAIVAWMKSVLEERGWNPRDWVRAGEDMGLRFHPTTITRVMKEDYEGVTSLPVLGRLAKAAGVAPPDFTGSNASAELVIPLPTKASLLAMVITHFEGVARSKPVSRELLEDVVKRMHASLASLQDDPDAARVPQAARSAALQIGKRFGLQEPPEDDE